MVPDITPIALYHELLVLPAVLTEAVEASAPFGFLAFLIRFIFTSGSGSGQESLTSHSFF